MFKKSESSSLNYKFHYHHYDRPTNMHNQESSSSANDLNFYLFSLISYTENSYILYVLSNFKKKIIFDFKITFSLILLTFDDSWLLKSGYLSFSLSWVYKEADHELSTNVGVIHLTFKIFRYLEDFGKVV